MSFASLIDGLRLTERFFDEAGNRGAVAILGMLSGAVLTWLLSRWKRHKEHQCIIRGDARDTVVIHQHLVTTAQVRNADGTGMRDVPVTLRVRSLGQEVLSRVVPNGHLASDLLERALRVTPHDTLLSMEGAEGSYLLETLNNFVCDRVANAPFEHDQYVMAPCCEPAELTVHQPITVLLISVADLALFEKWEDCRDVKIEHGSDGMRILTLMELARRFRAEREIIAGLVKAGECTRHTETIYVLDLGLDRRSADVPVRDVPWNRFADVLRELKLGLENSELEPAHELPVPIRLRDQDFECLVENDVQCTSAIAARGQYREI